MKLLLNTKINIKKYKSFSDSNGFRTYELNVYGFAIGY